MNTALCEKCLPDGERWGTDVGLKSEQLYGTWGKIFRVTQRMRRFPDGSGKRHFLQRISSVVSLKTIRCYMKLVHTEQRVGNIESRGQMGEPPTH